MKLLPFFAALVLSGCANYSLKTNVDKSVYQHHLAISQVKVVTSMASLSNNAVYLGAVEGDSCQVEHNAPPASNAESRTQARIKAYKLGASAVLFTSCVVIDDKQCLSHKVCFGKAYRDER